MKVSVLLDLNYLHLLSEGDPFFEQELLELFVEDAQVHLMLLKAAIESQDLETVGREVHHLKGASSNVGASSMQSLAVQLEQEVHQGSLEHVPRLFLELQATHQAIAALVATRKSNL